MNLNILLGFKSSAFLIFIQTQVVSFLASVNILKLAAESFWHDSVSLWQHHFYLVGQDVPASSCIVSSPNLELAISPGNPGFLKQEAIFEDYNLGTTGAYCDQISF